MIVRSRAHLITSDIVYVDQVGNEAVPRVTRGVGLSARTPSERPVRRHSRYRADGRYHDMPYDRALRALEEETNAAGS